MLVIGNDATTVGFQFYLLYCDMAVSIAVTMKISVGRSSEFGGAINAFRVGKIFGT